MSDIIMYFVTPCLIINSFNIAFDKSKLEGLLICLTAYMVIQIAAAALSFLVFRKGDASSIKVLRFAVIFSNVGYMGIPLQKAVLGDEGVFYGSVCVAAFNIFLWTYGIICMSGDKKQLSGKKLIFNPGIIAVSIGLIVFIFSIKLPLPIASAIKGMSELNTPLAMMVIGFNLARSNVLSAFKNKSVYAITFLRLILVPLASLGVLLALGVSGTILVSIVIAASAPVAAVTTVFSVKYDTDVSLSVKLVAITTLLSIVTMSAIVALAQMF